MKRDLFYILAGVALLLSIIYCSLSFIFNANVLGAILLVCAYISGAFIVKIKSENKKDLIK